jgi:hypothetical protein
LRELRGLVRPHLLACARLDAPTRSGWSGVYIGAVGKRHVHPPHGRTGRLW